jgi:hypothetical protein
MIVIRTTPTSRLDPSLDLQSRVLAARLHVSFRSFVVPLGRTLRLQPGCQGPGGRRTLISGDPTGGNMTTDARKAMTYGRRRSLVI